MHTLLLAMHKIKPATITRTFLPNVLHFYQQQMNLFKYFVTERHTRLFTYIMFKHAIQTYIDRALSSYLF